MISKSELDIKKGEVYMSPDEISELLQYADVFKKYLNKKANEIQAQLGGCKLQGREVQAYVALDVLKGLIDGLKDTEIAYTEFIKEHST